MSRIRIQLIFDILDNVKNEDREFLKAAITSKNEVGRTLEAGGGSARTKLEAQPRKVRSRMRRR